MPQFTSSAVAEVLLSPGLRLKDMILKFSKQQ